jgi:hypothetical protein
MIGLAFQNPDIMFFTAFQEGECCLCSKRTKSFFLVSLNSALCLDCFDIFFVRRNMPVVRLNTDNGNNSITEDDGFYGGENEHF